MKTVLRLMLVTFGITAILLIAACTQSEDKGLNWQVDDFTYTNQDGQPYGMADLKGKVWVADFVFVHCVTVCPPMTSNLVMLQNELKKANVEAEIVSFTVDPERDTVEVLKEYGMDYNVDFSNWNFLTGYSQEEIAKFAKDSFKSVVVQDRKSDQVIHGTSFFIVDKYGVVYSKHDGVYDTPIEQMVQDIKKLNGIRSKDNSKTDNTASGNGGTNEPVKSEHANVESIYRQSCYSCHGADLKGNMGPNLQKVGSKLSEEQIRGIIEDGKGRMPGFKSRLSDNEIEELVVWLAAKK